MFVNFSVNSVKQKKKNLKLETQMEASQSVV